MINLGQKTKKILGHIDIVDIISKYLVLEKMGDNYRAPCPFHTDADPSLSVSPSLGIFKCFGAGCGKGGNAANFIQYYEDIPYQQALSKLAKLIGRPDLAPQEEKKGFEAVFEMNQIVSTLYQNSLFTKNEVSEKARLNLRERRITQETAKRFGLGYSPNSWTWLADQTLNKNILRKAGLILKTDAGHFRDFFKNRIIFPFYSQDKIMGFTGRTLGIAKKIPKYLNSKDSDWFKKQQLLYGWNFNRKFIVQAKEVIIVEGQFDVLQLFQRGITNTVAVSGSYFNANTAGLLSKSINRATIFSDGDSAGVGASLRIAELLAQRGIELNIIYLEGKDPDECAKYKHRFNWDKLNSKYSNSLVQFAFKHEGVEGAIRRLASYSNKVKVSYAMRELSELSGFDEPHLEHWLKEFKSAPLSNEVITAQSISLALEEELLLLSAYNKDCVLLDSYLTKKLGKQLVAQISEANRGTIPQLAENPQYATRLYTLEHVKDLAKYSNDLLTKTYLSFLKEDVKTFKNKFKETGDIKYLDKMEKWVKKINKVKMRIKNGTSKIKNESNSYYKTS
jgi:DNA primase catalytic core